MHDVDRSADHGVSGNRYFNLQRFTGAAASSDLHRERRKFLTQSVAVSEEYLFPEDSSCRRSVEEPRDESQWLRLVHAAEDVRDLGNSFGNTPHLTV